MNILRAAISLFVLSLTLVAMFVPAGCLQPGSSPSPEPVTLPATIATPALPVPNDTTHARPSPRTTTIPSRALTTVPVLENFPAFKQFAGSDYSIDFPSGWNASAARHPLRQYSYSGAGCTVTQAYELDQELRTWHSPDNQSAMLASIVSTQRDIWPRDFSGQIVYADIANSFFGNPETCANTPAGTFPLTGITDVPVEGVSFRGTKFNFGTVNATGFTTGTGTCMIVTGQNRRGVFCFYSMAKDRDLLNPVSERIFNSIRLDSGF